MKEKLTLKAQSILYVIRRQFIRHTRWPPVGWVNFGSMRRLQPISRRWGSERGQIIDRYYIISFLGEHARDVRGHVLEVGTDFYTRTFGGDKVMKSDVLNVTEGNSKATVIADLTQADHIHSDTFDCIILTQTLNFIFDTSAAMKAVYRILKPGGVVLATVSGITKISRADADRWGHFWNFTTQSARRLFELVFPPEQIHIRAYGNVLAATAFLHGLAAEDLSPPELEFVDPDFEVSIAIRAIK